MSSSGENPDLAALKNLLTSWHVGILFEFFKEEDITMDDLKMMQVSHINALLRDFKMGVKIRFEYHLNSWRNKLGIPLKTVQLSHPLVTCCCNYNDNIGNSCAGNRNIHANATVNVGTKRRRIDQNVVSAYRRELDENEPPLSPQSVNSNQSLVNMLTPNEIANIMPIAVLGSPNGKTLNTDDEVEIENLPLTDLLSDYAHEDPPKFPSKPVPEKCPVSLKQILQMSGSRGMSILKFFGEKNHLTNIHRTQLIQIIVDFFDENDYHLSLNMSHNLEWEILQMFPTEKLEYYRTEKRGKIYVKFSNMKRYKRERSNKVRTEIESQPQRPRRHQFNNVDNSETNNVVQEHSTNIKTKIGDPDVMVKEENLSDDE